MSAARIITEPPAPPRPLEELKRQAEFILSALEAAGNEATERRQAPRLPYRVQGVLRLYSDSNRAEPWILFTRDVSPRGLGFITPERLPLGYGGVVEVEGPDGTPLQLDCTLLRCRETVNGWFEGAVYFNRPQWRFAKDEVKE
jgi:hypothetical protein